MLFLFSYGTLRDPAVQLAVFGRELSGRPDELIGFARTVIQVRESAFVAANGGVHAIVQYTGRDDDRTAGTVLELTEAELAMADAYEPPGYTRVEAQFASGNHGWVYADAAASAPTDRAAKP